MLKDLIKLTNTLASMDRALTGDENDFYTSSLRYIATVLRTSETEARLAEIVAERELDELSEFDGDREA